MVRNASPSPKRLGDLCSRMQDNAQIRAMRTWLQANFFLQLFMRGPAGVQYPWQVNMRTLEIFSTVLP